MAPPPRLGYLPSELPANTCFDGIRTNMSRKGPFECQTDSPRRPHLRPRKGTNLGAGNPSPASCSASSRCQPCAPLARLKKYFQSFRANPSTSTLPQDRACQREALGARSALISHLAKQGQGKSKEAKFTLVCYSPQSLAEACNMVLPQAMHKTRHCASHLGHPRSMRTPDARGPFTLGGHGCHPLLLSFSRP